MAATFDPGLATPKDRIRQRIGDTVVARAKIDDATIAAYLAQGMSELHAARRLCLDLAAQYAPVGDIALDNQMSRFSKVYNQYIELAAAIGEEIASATAMSSSSPQTIVGGIGDCRGPLSPSPGCCNPWDC